MIAAELRDGRGYSVSGLANRYGEAMRSPVFVTGSVRSGTSALTDVLRDVGYHGWGEGHFLSLIHYIEAAVDQHFKTFGLPPDPEVMLGNIDRLELKRKLFETFRTLANESNYAEGPWFDKTPDPGMIEAIPIVRELWPVSVIVFLKRRGIENVISRMKKFPGDSFESHCVGWAGSMAAWRKTRQQLPPECFIEVEQRDMIQRPAPTTRSLCEFLQVDESAVPAACKVMSTPGPQESEKGSASKTLSLAESGWTVEQTETFLKHCESEMKEFGYTMDEHYILVPDEGGDVADELLPG